MAHNQDAKGVSGKKLSGRANKPSSSLFAVALEQRFMFDAAGVATVAETHAETDHAPLADQVSKATGTDTADSAPKQASVPPASDAPGDNARLPEQPAAVAAGLDQSQESVRSVVFVDTTVTDYQTLIKDIAPDAKVVLLDPNREAFSQMAEALSGMSDLEAIHVISHGNEGHLYIAGRAYWADGLANRGQDLQAIGAALKSGGDILFYACNVGSGEVGQAFAQTIHRLTGADVAVSSDQTGNAAGQNWTLEVQTGAIEATTPFAIASMEAFSGKLATITVTSATGTAAGSLNHALVNAGDGDIIIFDPTLASGKVSLGVTTTILATAAQNFTINGDVDGDGIADITISGDNGDSTTTSADYRGITYNAAGKTLAVKNLIFEGFYTSSAVQGVLTLQNGSMEVDGVIFRNNLNNAIATLTTPTSLTIKNSIFTQNMGEVTGTAAFAVVRSQVAGTLTIENSLFADNSYVANAGSPSATYPGATILQQNTTSAFTVNIRNTTIANNSYINNNSGAAQIKTAGIGIYYGGSTGTATVNVYNTIIAGNSGNLAGTAFADPNSITYDSAKVTLNASNNYQGAITGTATFVDSTNANLSLRDYRPASTATTLINQGNSSNASYYGGSYDIRGIDRIRDSALDLGAYEVHWNAGEPTVDLNGAGTGNNETVNTSAPGSGVLIAPSANLAQTDTDTRLLGATVALSGITDTGNETLTLSTADINTARTYGIAVRANNGATITLTGAASVADYQSVIRLIQYKNTAGSVTDGTRTATITVNDGETTSTARTSSIIVSTVPDTTPPAVSSIAVSGSPAANAASVSYTVTFSESVTGVDSSDFTLAPTGTATGTIASVTGSGSTYTVTVNGISGTGTLGLNLNSSGTNIQDAANNAIAAGFTGTTRTVDRDAPVFTSSATVSAAENQSTVVTLAATDANGPLSYSIVGGADQAKFSLTGSALSFASSPDFETPTDSDSNNVYVVTVRATDANGNTTDQTISVTVTNVNEAPVSSVNPAISGTAQVGNSLTASNGTWSDPENNTLSYSYQWYRADDNSGTNLVAISGATAATYALSTSDAHKYLRVVVTANDGNGGTQTATSAFTTITNSTPTSTVVPSITGSFSPGSSLSASTGTWTDADGDTLTYTYQWYRADNSTGTGEVAISGATSSTYSVVVGDLSKYLRVVVTANDSNGGTQTATSTRSQVTSNGAPVNTIVPSITGTATVGNALSTGSGTWNDPDGDSLSFTYQWYRADDTNGTNAAAITGATSASYTLTTSDAHKYLRVVVTANDGNGGTQTATSTYTAITNSAPVNSVAPSVSGTATVGNALSTTNGTWSDADGDGRSFTYQWYRADDNSGTNAAAITGATSASYTLTTSDAHKYLRVVVTANDGNGGTQTATSTYTAITNSAPVNSVAPSVSGTATVGNALSTTNGTWSDADGDGRSFTYQWYRADDTNGTNATAITGATSANYTLTTSDAHKFLRVVVTANDGKGGTQTATSTYTAITNSAPVNSVAPSVSGTATVGNALSTTNGTWSDADGDGRSFTYQWYRADDTNGTNATAITGATSANYTLTTSDAHKFLRVVVTANDGKGGTQTATSTYTAITNSAPVNSVAPSVSGTATVGNALSTSNGTWSDADGDGRSFTYQWYRADDTNGTNAAVITGATSASYTLTTSDAHKFLRVVVTANDGQGGTQTATSTYTAITNSAPVNSVAPSVSGTATVGNALSTTNGTWSDPDGDGRSFTYQWYRADDNSGTNATAITGATSASYTLTTSDAHKFLRVVVTANDGKGGTQTATSTYTAITNSAPVNSVAPSVSGTATVGNALSTSNGTWSDADGDGRSFTYQWYRADDTNGTNATAITGATSASYTLTTSDAHKFLRVVVTANDGKGGTQTATSTYTAITNSAPVNSVAPSVSGTATVGNALSTSNGTWSDADGDGRSFTYQWYRADDNSGTNAAVITGATSASYTLTTSDAHKFLRVVVTANDGQGGTQTATSTYTAITNSAPVNSVAPSVSGTATVGNALSTTNGTWSDPDGDGRSFTYQWYRADDNSGTNATAITGATSASYTLTTSDAHKFLRVVVTANDGKGGTQTATSTYTAITNSAPVNSVAPSVSGTATVGNALSTSNGTWSDADGDGRSFTYQWYRADDNSGTNAAVITGATSASYTLTTSDAHKFLRVVVTANDGQGGTQTATSTYTAITNSAPVNSVAPSVSGTATVGNALSTTNGTWSDADGDGRSFTYQWYRADDTNGTNAAVITGATSASYTLTTSDAHKFLRVVVTANDGKGGTQTATSTYTAITNSAPVNSVAPSVSGTATVGNALSTTNGTWSDADGDGRSFTYQWYRADDNSGTNATAITGATSASYTLTTSDAHKFLRVVVTANDGKGGTQTATSTYTAITNRPPVNFSAPEITGTLLVGNALSTTNGTWTDIDGDSQTFSYQWYRADNSTGTNLTAITGATSASYTLTAAEANKYVRVVVTANDGFGGTQSGTSTYTLVGNTAPVLATPPMITVTDTVGNTSFPYQTGSFVVSDPDLDTLTFSFAGGTSANFTDGGITYDHAMVGSYGTLYLNSSTGAYLYAPNASVIKAMTNGVAITFPLFVTDGSQSDSKSMYITISGVNDAPVLTDTVVTLPSVPQETGAPSGAVGSLVSDLVGLGRNVTDVDTGALTGIALVATRQADGGTWYYSLDNGTTWQAVGPVDDSGNALLLRSTDRIFYQPSGTSAQTMTDAITFRAWDQSSGTAGTKVATGANNTVSVATDTAALTILPRAPGAPDLAASSDTGVSSSDNLTSANRITLTGSGANANSTVRLYAGTTLLATQAADGNGNYSFADVDVSALTGETVLTVRQLSGADESGPSTSLAVTFDRTVPTISITPMAGDDVLNGTEGAAGQTVAGTTTGVADGGTVTVTLGGKTYNAVVANNRWSVAIPATDLASLPDGTSNVRVQVASASGVPTEASRSLTVSQVPPVITAVTAPAGTAGIGASVDVKVTFDKAVTVNGTPQLPITLDDGTTVMASYVAGSGGTELTFRYVVATGASDPTGIRPAASLSLNGGTIQSASGTNATLALANVADMSGVRVDGIVPTVTSLTARTPDGAYRAGSTITIDVRMSEVVTVDGVPTLTLNTGRAATYSSGSGTDTLTFTYVVQAGDNVADLDIASNSALTGTIRDQGNNSAALTLPNPGAAGSLGAARDIVLDTTPPSVATVSGPANGTYLPGQTVSFFVNASEAVTVAGGLPGLQLNVGGTTREAVFNRAGSTDTRLRFDYVVVAGDNAPTGVAVTGLALNGATVTDRAGAVLDIALKGVADTTGVIIQSSPPARPADIALAPGSDTGLSASDNLTGNNRPTIAGTAAAGSTVTVMVDGAAVGTTTANAQGGWSFAFANALADGNRAITATATNQFGLSSPASDALALVIDTAAPTVPAAPAITSTTATGPADETVSPTSRPTVAGVTEPGTNVRIVVDGTVLGTTTAGANGAWSFTMPAALADGVHSIRVGATDVAGNDSGLSVATNLTVDTTAPAAPTIAVVSAGSSTPVLAGTAEAGSLVTVTQNGATVGTARADATGAWRLTLANDLATGSYVFGARATDAAGNSGTAATTGFSVAPPPPPAPAPVVNNGDNGSGNTTTVVSSPATGTGLAPVLGTSLASGPTLAPVQDSTDAGRTVTLSSVGSGTSSTDAGRAITLSSVDSSSSSTDAGRTVTLSSVGGGQPSSTSVGGSVTALTTASGGTSSLGGGGLNGGLLGGTLGGSGLGGGLGGGLGAGLGSGLGGGLGGSGGLGGGGLGGGTTGTGLGGARGTEGPQVPNSTAPGTSTGSPRQTDAGPLDSPPALPVQQAQDMPPTGQPAFSRQVAQIHQAADAESAALLAALLNHVVPGEEAA